MRLQAQLPGSRPFPYSHPQVIQLPSRRGYFLLILDIGPDLCTEWIYSRN